MITDKIDVYHGCTSIESDTPPIQQDEGGARGATCIHRIHQGYGLYAALTGEPGLLIVFHEYSYGGNRYLADRGDFRS
ncbi:MAG: hypothetical protein E3J88_06635 [Anaerolineales bacterium]|nr:MAG: hypothetical protein E3J88_06635 [Anaerolineales bacterium]